MKATDSDLIARAVALGEHGRRSAPPNPWVGSVVVDEQGAIVGEGWHQRPGTPHAEVEALAAAGDARPRRHRLRHARALLPTRAVRRPCADALIAAGVARVVVALEDPDPRWPGAGIARLRAAGLTSTSARAPTSARRSLAPYLHHRRTGRAWCLVKTAMSLDGRTAAADGSSRWITGVAARADAHRLRAESQAVVIGAGTALADRPTPHRARRRPSRASASRCASCSTPAAASPPTGPLFDAALAPTLVVTTDAAPSEAVDALAGGGREGRDRPRGRGRRRPRSDPRRSSAAAACCRRWSRAAPTAARRAARRRAGRPARRVRRAHGARPRRTSRVSRSPTWARWPTPKHGDCCPPRPSTTTSASSTSPRKR